MSSFNLRIRIAKAMGPGFFLSTKLKADLAGIYERQSDIEMESENFSSASRAITKSISLKPGDEYLFVKQ